jgi:hypothetical protein
MKPETPYASLLIPPLGVVQGIAPTFHNDDGPQIIWLSEEAKAIKFEVDPSVRRYVVHPSGVIDAEY